MSMVVRTSFRRRGWASRSCLGVNGPSSACGEREQARVLELVACMANVVIARSARVVSGAALRRAHDLDGVAAGQEPAQ